MHARHLYLAVIAALLFPSMGVAEVTGDVELLRFIARGHQANIERITTWQGRARVNDFSQRSGEKQRHWDESLVEFLFDRESEAKRWNWSCIEDRTVTEAGELLRPPYFRNCMVKDGALYEFGYIVPEEMKRPYRLWIRPSEAEKIRGGGLADDFDPQFYLTVSGRNTPDTILWYYEHASSEKTGTSVVSRDGDLVTFENELDGSVNRWKFDLSKGCTPVAYDGEGPEVTEHWTYEYEKTGDTFVPKLVVYDYERRKELDGGEVDTRRRHREVRFLENRVNEPIDPAEFELEKLGLQPGDYVVDFRANVEYAYKVVPREVKRAEEEVLKEVSAELSKEVSAQPPTVASPTEGTSVTQAGQPAAAVPAAVPVASIWNWWGVCIGLAAGVAALTVVGVLVMKRRGHGREDSP